MAPELANGKVGEVASYDLKLENGDLIATGSASVKVEGIEVGSASIVLKIEGAAVLDVIAKAIPGTLDDAILGIAKAALLKK